MNNPITLSQEERQLLEIMRDLKPFESIEIKRSESGDIVYTYTQKKRYIFLTAEKA